MNISNISKEEKNVTVKLSADELVKLCNVLYGTEKDNKNELYYKLYSELMMARDVCQYGHVDDFCLERIVEARNHCGKGLSGILSDKDIEIFNAYIEDNDMPTSFGNTDWNNVYSKIVGEKWGEKAKEWSKRNIE